MSWLSAGTILGHHGGLLDVAEVRSKIHLAESNVEVGETLRRFDRQIGQSPFPLSCRVPEWTQEQPTPIRDVEMLWRLIFSALVDGDFLDTEAHFNKLSPGLRRVDQTLAGLLERFEARRSKTLSGSPDTPVNRARSEIYQTVLARAGQRPGLYKPRPRRVPERPRSDSAGPSLMREQTIFAELFAPSHLSRLPIKLHTSTGNSWRAKGIRLCLSITHK